MEHLPGKCQTLSSNFSTTKKIERKPTRLLPLGVSKTATWGKEVPGLGQLRGQLLRERGDQGDL
jgi:hypothetical protein